MSTTIRDLEEEIFKVEGVRIIIRLDPSVRIPQSYQKAYERCLGDARKLKLLLARIKRLVGDGVHLDTVLGSGLLAPEKTKLGVIRSSYMGS